MTGAVFASVESVIQSAVGDEGTLHLSGAGSPRPYVHTVDEVELWAPPSAHFREAMLAVGDEVPPLREAVRD